MLFGGKEKYSGKQIGIYTLDKFIGKGRYGLCFTAKADDGNQVVLKKFRPRRFKKNKDKNAYEAVILSTLNDRRIPELLGVINQKNAYCFVLEHKPGRTLEHLLFRDKHRFSEEEFFRIGCQLIDIVGYLHENGVVHRDIRIPNILIDNEELFLIDFGLARWADDRRYPYNLDFSYLGDLLIYLLYSSYEKKGNAKALPWYEELSITNDQKVFLKKLLGLDIAFTNIREIEINFKAAFKPV